MPTAQRLVSSRPADVFTQAFPLGNGSLGALPFGGIGCERVLLNEAGCWSGSPQEADRGEAVTVLPEIRRLLLAGEHHAAEALVEAHFTCAGVGSGQGQGADTPFGCYQMLGELTLTWPSVTEATAYHRELDLDGAVSTSGFTAGGAQWSRESFTSHPDQVLALRLTGPAGRVVLAVDGLQPDVGHEVLWVVRDVLSGAVLLARSLLSGTREDLAPLLAQVRDAASFYAKF